MRTRMNISSLVLFLSAAVCRADLPPLVVERVINAPVEKVWPVFSTSDGFKLMGVAQCDVDLSIGGKIRSKYSADGALGDESTIENTILAYEPLRMMAFRCTKFPAGFPFPEAIARTWSVTYFDDLGDGRTRVTLKTFGYGDDEESAKCRRFFDAGNAWTLEKVKASLEGTPAPTRAAHDVKGAASDPRALPKPVLIEGASPESSIEVEGVIDAPVAEVWRSWTTNEGIRAFLVQGSNVELRIGGPYELFFGMDQPEGSRGSETCKVLSYEPMRMLSFSWNAPPKFPKQRLDHTWVVLRFEAIPNNQTRVHLSHEGWGEKVKMHPGDAEAWHEVRGYFVNAWPRVMAALQGHYAKK